MARRPTPPGQLSPCEARTLAAVAEGLTLQQVADRRGRSRYTIQEQADRARHRLGAGSLRETVQIAAERGLIPAPTPTLEGNRHGFR